MTHQWHDTYRHQSTPAHHFDPRSKLVVALCFIGCILLSDHFTPVQAGGYLFLLGLSALLSHVPFNAFVGRVMAVLPFAFLMMVSLWFSHLSWQFIELVLLKSVFSIAAMTLLALTTPFPDLLRALHECRLPRLLLLFLAFLYRYGLVLQEDAVALQRAWKSRFFGRRWVHQWFHFGHVIAALFVRSYERAERVYAAMQSRGLSSEVSFGGVLHWTFWDLFLVGSYVGILVALRCGRW